jgi:FtsP/CotA-like multicopper oxidase with cupredoxin domain
MSSYRNTVLVGGGLVVALALPFVAIARDDSGATRHAATATPSAHDEHASHAAAAAPSATAKIDFNAMDEHMAMRTTMFPAKTAGLGAQPLAPIVRSDGTKEFHLTTKVVTWEVEPGKLVDAWTYNGTVPGPTIKVAVGDKVRVVVKNELPESTAVHFHGIRLPNSQDGVPDITQAPIKPGTTFTYEFTADRIAVGMYHSHHNAVTQVPNGLAGTFLVGEMPLPAGVRVSQVVLDDSGVIGFALNGKSFPATAPIVAKEGEWAEVHYMNEGGMFHPMHLHGLDQLVIAKDGYPLAQPYLADTIAVGPGERYTVLVKADVKGTWAWHCHILSHAETADGMFGMVTAMIVS